MHVEGQDCHWRIVLNCIQLFWKPYLTRVNSWNSCTFRKLPENWE
jgi:hypothetical protein